MTEVGGDKPHCTYDSAIFEPHNVLLQACLEKNSYSPPNRQQQKPDDVRFLNLYNEMGSLQKQKVILTLLSTIFISILSSSL